LIAPRTRRLRRSACFFGSAIARSYFFLPSLRKINSPAYFTPLPL
jgi:hypothetical protein